VPASDRGNWDINTGGGLATLFGGGAGDQLVATGRQAQDLVAGIGNETLSAVSSSGADALVAGSGKDQRLGGSGASTMIGGSGKDIFAFVRSLNGGVDQVVNFTSADKIGLPGYRPRAVPSALSSQTFSNGSVTITLADNTRVTFVGVSALTRKNFITGH
jgi:Ca2+-binding RTX toxin-like protein